MLVFILLTMTMGGVVLLSASLFLMNGRNTHHPKPLPNKPSRSVGTTCDEVALACTQVQNNDDQSAGKEAAQILEFTRTSHKSSKQLPLLGMPDKAFYHIH